MRKLKFKLTQNAFPFYGTTYTTCIGGCDPSFNELLNIKTENLKCVRPTNDSGYSSIFNGSRSTVVSNSASVRNSGSQQSRVRSAIDLSGNNMSIGLVRTHNSNQRDANRSRKNNRNVKKQNESTNSDTWIDTRNFRSSSNESRQPRVEQTKVWGEIDSNAVIVCRCNENAIPLTVRKEGPNQGIGNSLFQVFT